MLFYNVNINSIPMLFLKGAITYFYFATVIKSNRMSSLDKLKLAFNHLSSRVSQVMQNSIFTETGWGFFPSKPLSRHLESKVNALSLDLQREGQRGSGVTP